MKTCNNPSGKCLHEMRGLEGKHNYAYIILLERLKWSMVNKICITQCMTCAVEIVRWYFLISIVCSNGLCICLEWRWGQNTPKHILCNQRNREFEISLTTWDILGKTDMSIELLMKGLLSTWLSFYCRLLSTMPKE